MNKKTKFLMFGLGGVAVSAAAIIPAVSLSSCSGGSTYVEPLAPHTINATSDADAKTQLNAYFKKNASLDRLNSDLEASSSSGGRLYSSISNEHTITASAGDKEGTVNIKEYYNYEKNFSKYNIYQKMEMSYENIPVIPILELSRGNGPTASQSYNAAWCLVGYGDRVQGTELTTAIDFITNPADTTRGLFKTQADAKNAVNQKNPASGSYIQYVYQKITTNMSLEGKTDYNNLKETTTEGWTARIVTLNTNASIVGSTNGITATSMNVTVNINPVQSGPQAFNSLVKTRKEN